MFIMIQEVQRNNISQNCSIRTSTQNNDSVKLFDISCCKSESIIKSVDKQYSELAEYARTKLPDTKTSFWTRLVGFNEETKNELIKLIDDEKINQKIKDYIAGHGITDLRTMLHDKNHQNNLINLVSEYSKEENYPNTYRLLNKKIIRFELKSFLSGI